MCENSYTFLPWLRASSVLEPRQMSTEELLQIRVDSTGRSLVAGQKRRRTLRPYVFLSSKFQLSNGLTSDFADLEYF